MKGVISEFFHNIWSWCIIYFKSKETSSGANNGYLFKATGAVQNTASNNSYGGVVYSYSSKSIRLWYPPVTNHGTQYFIYIDKMYGGTTYNSVAKSVEVEIITIKPYGTCRLSEYLHFIHFSFSFVLTLSFISYLHVVEPCMTDSFHWDGNFRSIKLAYPPPLSFYWNDLRKLRKCIVKVIYFAAVSAIFY